jgi:hypothetical protein
LHTADQLSCDAGSPGSWLLVHEKGGEMRKLVIGILVALLVACGGGSTQPSGPPVTGTPSGPTVRGTWKGVSVIANGLLTYPITLDLVESGGVVTGSGLMGNWILSANGTFTNPNIAVTLTFTSGGVRTVLLRGTLSGNTITGQLNGDLWGGGSPITLSR